MRHIHTTDWTLTNNQGLDIIGNTDHPADDSVGDSATPLATLVLLHGFKGYKDYGFIPVLAKELAKAGVLVHRFNFSCSGMTNKLDTFARPDLFALDTWNRQVEDVGCVFDAIESGEILGKEMPMFLCGHSRGGGTALLASGRQTSPKLAGVVTINSVASCNSLSDEMQREMLDNGFIKSASARTGQELRIGAAWLQEQIDDPVGHDVLGLCRNIDCSKIILHGSDDQAVDIGAGEAIAGAVGAELQVIVGGNHVLNMANPALVDAEISPQLGEVIGLLQNFVIANGL
ncbi:MAG: alpha/beta hydrolase [Phycisphaerales bacterium]|nr:alpha/beta hydrolase [Phycisphaerales bacterium]